MNSEPFGIFGPGGLLAKIQTEEVDDNDNAVDQSTNKVSKNAMKSSTSDDRENCQQHQQSCDCDTIVKLSSDVSDSKLASDADQPVPFVRLTDLPPIEAAFSIEEVQYAIFSPLDPEDLLRCRLVSSSWLRMATNDKLLSSYEETIRIKCNPSRNIPAAVTVKGQKRGLKDLTDTLDGLGQTPFLASASLDLKTTISHNEFFKCFDRYGFIVTDLQVTFQTKENGKRFVYQMDALLEFVTKLITEQMPNLKNLSLYFKKNAQFVGSIKPQLLESIKNGSYCEGKQNQSLREIDFDEQTPYTIIDAVCCLAPEAEEILISNLLGFCAKNKHRVYLLKKLDFTPSLRHWDKVYALDDILSTEEKLCVKELTTDFSRVHDTPDVWPHLATLFTMILEKSCPTLEVLDLVLSRAYFLPGTVLPRMENVKMLYLSLYDDETTDWSWFPQGISIATTFPNLHTLSFDMGNSNSVKEFLSLCKKEEVVSVQEIMTNPPNIEEKLFQKRFPNALVNI